MPSSTKTFRMMPTALKLCKWAGLWHDTDPHKVCWPALLTMLGLAFWYVLPGVGFILNRERPLAALMKANIEVIAMSSFCLRIGLYVRNRAILQLCYRELHEMFNDFVNSMNEEVQELLERLQRPTERLTIVYLCCALSGIFMYGGAAGLIAIYRTVFGSEKVADYPVTFMEADFIIIDHRSNFWYWLPVFITSATVFAKLTLTHIAQEAFCWNLMYHVSYLLKIVQIEISTLDSCESAILFKSKLETVVRIHTTCFSNILRLEKSLNLTLTLLYGLCVFNSCFAMLIVAIVFDVKIFFMMGFALSYLIFLIFSFSMLGTELTTTSLAISDAIYNLRWYERTIEEQRYLLFMMMRSQRMCGITVGKFLFASRASFARAIKTAFSYFTIMHQLYGNR